MPREEVWFCMRNSRVAEKYIGLERDMSERCMTAVRCAAGVTDGFGGGTALRISSEPIVVCYGDGQTDR